MTIFERSSGGVQATDAGRDFLHPARSILGQVDSLVTRAHRIGRGEAGRLTIGFYTSPEAGNLRATLVDYARRFPELELEPAGLADRLVIWSQTPEVEREGTVTSAPLHRQLNGLVHRNIHRVSA